MQPKKLAIQNSMLNSFLTDNKQSIGTIGSIKTEMKRSGTIDYSELNKLLPNETEVVINPTMPIVTTGEGELRASTAEDFPDGIAFRELGMATQSYASFLSINNSTRSSVSYVSDKEIDMTVYVDTTAVVGDILAYDYTTFQYKVATTGDVVLGKLIRILEENKINQLGENSINANIGKLKLYSLGNMYLAK